MTVLLISFQFGYILFLFCLISLAILNKSDKSGQLYLFPDVREKVFNFSPWGMKLAAGLSYTTFIMLKYIFAICILLTAFIIKKVVNVFQCWFWCYWDDYMIFIHYFVHGAWFLKVWQSYFLTVDDPFSVLIQYLLISWEFLFIRDSSLFFFSHSILNMVLVSSVILALYNVYKRNFASSPLSFIFKIAWEELWFILSWIFGRIHQWSYQILNFYLWRGCCLMI